MTIETTLSPTHFEEEMARQKLRSIRGKNATQSPSSSDSEKKGIQRPDFHLVVYDEGEAIQIGRCWTNEGTGKKGVVELDITKIPSGSNKLRSYLRPTRVKRASRRNCEEQGTEV